MSNILRIAVVVVLLFFLVDNGSAATLTVNASGGGDYTRIQDAINNATAGDTVLVYGGTYFENVNVNKRIILKGIGNPIVDANGTGSAITLSVSGITLEGFTAVRAFEAGIKVSSRNNTMSNNSALNNVQGIYLYYSNNNTLINNNALNNTGFGFLLSNSNNNTVKNNNASNNNVGIALTNSRNNTIDRNVINLNQYAGITTDNSDYNIIIDNVVLNTNHGIMLSGSYNQFIGNIINKSTSAGFFISNGYDNTINANTISYTEYYIHSFGGGMNKIYHNNFMNNANGVHCSWNINYNYWDDGYPSGGNYWIDYIGTDSNNDGIGDTPYNIGCGDAQDRYPLMSLNLPPLTNLAIIIDETIDRYQINESLKQQLLAEYPNDPKMVNIKLKEIVNSDKKNKTIDAILASTENNEQRIDLQNIIDNSADTGAMIDSVTSYANTHMDDPTSFLEKSEKSFSLIKIPDEVVGAAELINWGTEAEEAGLMKIGVVGNTGTVITLINGLNSHYERADLIDKLAIPDSYKKALKLFSLGSKVGTELDKSHYYGTLTDTIIDGSVKFLDNEFKKQVPVWDHEDMKYIYPIVMGDVILVGTDMVYINDVNEATEVYQKDDFSSTYFIQLKGKPKEGIFNSIFGFKEPSYWRQIEAIGGGNWRIVPISTFSSLSIKSLTLLSIASDPLQNYTDQIKIYNVSTKDLNGDNYADVTEFDTDNDGQPDIYLTDTNNDSIIDIWKIKINSTIIMGYDINGDGAIDSYDLNNDGQIDAWDLDGNGNIDQIDLDGDGKIDAYDTDYNGALDTFVEYNRTLVVLINSLQYGQIFKNDDIITFNGSVYNGTSNGTPPFNFSWNSSIDGFLSYGNNISRNLSLGNHTIALNVEDSLGIKDNDTVRIIVSPVDTPLPEIRHINGTVIDSINKTSIAGVTVSANSTLSTTSNATGFYSFAVNNGTYNLTATFDITYYTNTTTVSTIGQAVVVQDIELMKKPTGNIIGSVTSV